MGDAAALGPLSVPAAWTTSAPHAGSPPSPPDTRVDAAAPGRTFQRALMATITGRSSSATVVRSRLSACAHGADFADSPPWTHSRSPERTTGRPAPRRPRPARAP
ncbi:hypothetical protein [Mycobacterium scrofulaceum]|uniref:hypothetical protein n=1 Tax=Mycobacterium scrofulaceum TaxID=1783 RepID=UPI003B0226C2